MLWFEGVERLRIDSEGEWLGFPREGGKRRLQRHLRALAGHLGWGMVGWWGQGGPGEGRDGAACLTSVIPHRFGVVSVSS